MPFKTTDRQGLNGSTLKFIAIFSMIVDHGGYFLVGRFIKASMQGAGLQASDGNMRIWALMCRSNQILASTYRFTRAFGRIAFPLFVFLLAEGYFYTRSKTKYLIRLAILSIISEIPFNLAVSGKFIYPYEQNVVFTLLLGFAAAWGHEYISGRIRDGALIKAISRLSFFIPGAIISYLFMNGLFNELDVSGIVISKSELIMIMAASAVVTFGCSFIFVKKDTVSAAIAMLPLYAATVIANLICSDYKGYGVIAVFAMIVLRGRRLSGALFMCLSLVLFRSNELFGLLALVPVYFYNGERGAKGQYLYYLVYPVQFILFYVLNL